VFDNQIIIDELSSKLKIHSLKENLIIHETKDFD